MKKLFIGVALLVALMLATGCPMPITHGSMKVVTTAVNGGSGLGAGRAVMPFVDATTVSSLMVQQFDIAAYQWHGNWATGGNIEDNVTAGYEFNPAYRSTIDVSNVEPLVGMTQIDRISFIANLYAVQTTISDIDPTKYWFGNHNANLPAGTNITSTPVANVVNWSKNQAVSPNGATVIGDFNTVIYNYINQNFMGNTAFTLVVNGAVYDVYVNSNDSLTPAVNIGTFNGVDTTLVPGYETIETFLEGGYVAGSVLSGATTFFFVPMNPISISVSMGDNGYPVLDNNVTLVFTVDLNNLIYSIDSDDADVIPNTGFTVNYTQDSINAPVSWTLGVEQ